MYEFHERSARFEPAPHNPPLSSKGESFFAIDSPEPPLNLEWLEKPELQSVLISPRHVGQCPN